MAVKRGDAAREAVKNKIIEAFRQDFVDFADKKIYVQARDGVNGEMIQFAISMTMPKTPIVAGSSAPSSAFDAVAAPKTELSAEDDKKVKELMDKLGISDEPW